MYFFNLRQHLYNYCQVRSCGNYGKLGAVHSLKGLVVVLQILVDVGQESVGGKKKDDKFVSYNIQLLGTNNINQKGHIHTHRHMYKRAETRKCRRRRKDDKFVVVITFNFQVQIMPRAKKNSFTHIGTSIKRLIISQE